MLQSRRGFLLGLGAAITAPAIIRPGLLMPVKPFFYDGIGLRTIPILTVWNGFQYLDIPESSLLRFELGSMRNKRAFGVVMNRPVESKMFCGDVVALA